MTAEVLWITWKDKKRKHQKEDWVPTSRS